MNNLTYIKDQWHPTRNDCPIPALESSLGDKYWWKCEKGHEWQENVKDRIANQICPICNSSRRATEYYNLLNLRPDIAIGWHPIKNKGLTPDEATPHSSKKVWWICDKEHEWEAAIYRRATGYGCPYCSNFKTSTDNNLAASHPELIKQWHDTLNAGLTPYDIVPGSHKKVWWMCDKAHEWQARIKVRTGGSGCPICSGRIRMLSKELKDPIIKLESLPQFFPEMLVMEWHPTKNGLFSPTNASSGSHKMIWWQCKKGHNWKTNIVSRVKGSNCPECTNRKIGKDNNLAVLRPDLAAEWDFLNNGGLTPFDVVPKSDKRVAWICSNGHQWDARIANRSKGDNCPECTNRKAGKDNNLAVLRPDLAAKWDALNNGGLTPFDVVAGSKKKAAWICSNGHQWKAIIADKSKGANCPECTNRKAGKDNNLAVLRPDLAAKWDALNNSGLTPFNVTPGSNKKAAWICSNGHQWKAIIADRSKGANCLECTNRKAGKDNNLAVLRPDLAAEWDALNNGGLTPFDVVPGSGKKASWICSNGHQWNTRIASRSRGANCPECTNHKVEKDDSLAVLRPDLAVEWDFHNNGGLTPFDVTPGSGKKAAWICSSGHQWNARIGNRSKGANCPECTNRKIGKDNNLTALRPDLAAEWDFLNNGGLTPFDVVPGSSKKAAWICNNGHQWKAIIASRSRGNKCPECSNFKAGKDNNLAVLRPDLAAEWDALYNGGLTPFNVTPGSNKKAAWICSNGHQWKAIIASRSKGAKCRKCQNYRKS